MNSSRQNRKLKRLKTKKEKDDQGHVPGQDQGQGQDLAQGQGQSHLRDDLPRHQEGEDTTVEVNQHLDLDQDPGQGKNNLRISV